LTVPKAGHFVPNNNYWASYQFFTDYINYGRLECHKVDGDCSVVADRCEFMNQCSGHGTCQANGQCACDANWKSADCSIQSIALLDGY
jgi:hypothetical protein